MQLARLSQKLTEYFLRGSSRESHQERHQSETRATTSRFVNLRSQTLRKRTVNVGRCTLVFHIDGESMNKICRENALEPHRLRVKRFRVRNSVRATRRGDYNIRVLRAKEAVSSFLFVISRKIFQPGENSRGKRTS